MPKSVFQRKFPHLMVKKETLPLRTYSGELVPVVGSVDMRIKHCNLTDMLPVLIVDDGGRELPCLLGHNWLRKLKLNWQEVQAVQQDDAMDELKEKFKVVFLLQMGLITGCRAQLLLKPNSKPVSCKACSVPFALRQAVSRVSKRVTRTDWATPLVVVPKDVGA